MNTKEVALKFIEFYRSDDPLRKYDLYSEDCVSIESPANGDREEIIGLEKIKKRHFEFYDQFSEIFRKEISEPLVADHGFSIVITFDVTQSGERKTFKELCTFQVKDGRIVRQEFIY